MNEELITIYFYKLTYILFLGTAHVGVDLLSHPNYTQIGIIGWREIQLAAGRRYRVGFEAGRRRKHFAQLLGPQNAHVGTPVTRQPLAVVVVIDGRGARRCLHLHLIIDNYSIETI